MREFSLARMRVDWTPYVASPCACERLHSTLYDSADLRLARWGGSLELRAGIGWFLTVDVAGAAPHRLATFAFAGDDRSVPPGALELATAFLRGAAVKPVAELRTLRTTRHVLCDGDPRADVIEDDVRVVAGRRVVRRFVALAVDLRDGGDAALRDALTARLRAAGAGPADETPVTLHVLGGPAREPVVLAARCGPRGDAGELARAAIARSVVEIVRSDVPLRREPDEAAVHRARVAVRRLRSDLRTFVPVFDRDWALALRESLRWLSDGLAAARDADVLLARMRGRLARIAAADRGEGDALLAGFRIAREAAYGRVAAMLREPHYVALLDALIDAANRPQLNGCAGDAAREVVRPLMQDVWSSLRAAVRARGRPPSDRELHRIRIKAKRVRYAAEAFAEIAGSGARRFADRVAALQTILGEQHDAVVARRRLRAEADRPETAFVAGALAMLEAQAADDARAAWRRAWRRARVRRRRFWKHA